ncbi:hypothetical protein K461DRAFT_292044 [Myriangium duriaei CBS 260.36]|uniref:DUF5672 domain-containing protein n=1 Tax=Myriangium duriaei CBS 260.36 TaxID=1168546 RepID=A0A9P4J4Y9_9PEZI|nr:hypothetical protein K461DRAFT_292044 [Myriangium duriaei CBS 260.36]
MSSMPKSNTFILCAIGLWAFLVIVFLPYNPLRVPASIETPSKLPVHRLNTTWHRQIAIESVKWPSLENVQTPYGELNRKRVALLLDNRPLPYLIPVLLYFLATVEREWSFRFMGSEESLGIMEANPLIMKYVRDKKLFLDPIPYEKLGVKAVNSYDTMNKLLSRPFLYEEWLWPSEWLFLFQDDSMICANSKKTLNDFVDEEWSFMGVQMNNNNYTGGGLSLRRIPHLARSLADYSFDQWAADGRWPSEDGYFSKHMATYNWTKMPNYEETLKWGLVRDFPAGMEQMPFGFHPFSSDGMFRNGKPEVVKENQVRGFKYCPELAIIAAGRWDFSTSPDGSRPGGLGG